jgi:hypothetical protein
MADPGPSGNEEARLADQAAALFARMVAALGRAKAERIWRGACTPSRRRGRPKGATEYHAENIALLAEAFREHVFRQGGTERDLAIFVAEMTTAPTLRELTRPGPQTRGKRTSPTPAVLVKAVQRAMKARVLPATTAAGEPTLERMTHGDMVVRLADPSRKKSRN